MAAGWGTAATPLGAFPGALLGYALGLVGTAGLLWPRSAPVSLAGRAVGTAVRVCLAYQTTPQHAPGLFRLPSRWLRPHPVRLTVAALTLLPLAWAAADVPPVYTPPELTVFRSDARDGAWVRLPSMTEAEGDFLDGLSGDDRADYARVLVARRAAEADLERDTRREYHRRLLTALVAASTVPAGAFLLTLVAAAGPLLAAYHAAFETEGEKR